MGPEIAMAAGSLAGPILGYFGQREANYANMEIADNANRLSEVEAGRNRAFQQASADKAMSFSHDEATRQMDFQERMSSTAYQRARADMEKAGLNPILMAGQGGASAPPGASGNAQSASGAMASYTTATVQNALQSFATAARDIQQMQMNAASVRNIEAQTKKTLVDAEVNKRHIPESEIINQGFRIIKPYLNKLENYLHSPTPKTKSKPLTVPSALETPGAMTFPSLP